MGERRSRPGGQPGWERRIIPCWWLMGKERRRLSRGDGARPDSPPRRSASPACRILGEAPRRGAGSGA